MTNMRAGDEIKSFFIDSASARQVAQMITYRCQPNGHTLAAVKIVERQIKSVEVRFSDDPWQPSRLVYHYGDKTTWEPGGKE